MNKLKLYLPLAILFLGVIALAVKGGYDLVVGQPTLSAISAIRIDLDGKGTSVLEVNNVKVTDTMRSAKTGQLELEVQGGVTTLSPLSLKQAAAQP